jgi:hypothetical protein
LITSGRAGIIAAARLAATTSVELGYIAHNPALRVKTPKEKPRRIKAATGQDVFALMQEMPGPVARMVVHLAVQSGCRWGDLSELRGADVLVNPDDPETDYLDVQRAVADAGFEDNPLKDGSRFFVEDTTKGGTDRKIGLSAPLSRLLRIYVRENGIGPDDLLFPLSRLQAEWRAANPEPEPVVVVVPDDLGRTEPNARGRTYAHGTMSGYTAGRCKCVWCRRSFAVYGLSGEHEGFPIARRRRLPRNRGLSTRVIIARMTGSESTFSIRRWTTLRSAGTSRFMIFGTHTRRGWLGVGRSAFRS